jgi:hypothetical protein
MLQLKCYVMDMLYEVDLLLRKIFLISMIASSIMARVAMIRRGKRHLTVNGLALPRNQLPVDEEKSESLLSASQVKRLARKGTRVFLTVIRLVKFDSVPPVVASIAALSPDVPTSSVQPD